MSQEASGVVEEVIWGFFHHCDEAYYLPTLRKGLPLLSPVRLSALGQKNGNPTRAWQGAIGDGRLDFS